MRQSQWIGLLFLGILLGLNLFLGKWRRLDSGIVQGNRNEQKIAADRFFYQGIQQFQNRQLREALSSWEASLKIYRILGDHRGESDSLGNLGNAYYSLEQYDQAVTFHRKSLEIDRETGAQSEESDSLANLGLVYTSLGNYEHAIKLYNQALSIKREIGERSAEGVILKNLGSTYRFLGSYKRAIDFHNQSLSIGRETGNRNAEAAALGGLGNAYYSLGEHKRAIDFHTQSLSIKREISSRVGEAIALSNLGIVYGSLKRYKRAIDFHSQSLNIDRETGNRRGEATSLGNLGSSNYYLGHYEQAIVQFQESLGLAREVKNRYLERTTLASLGATFRHIGQTDTALSFFKQAVNITESIRKDNNRLDPSLKKSYVNIIADDYRTLSDLLLEQGRILEAQQVLDLLAIREIRDYNQNTRSTFFPKTGTIEFTPIEKVIQKQHDNLIAFGLKVLQCKRENCAALTDLEAQYAQLQAQFKENSTKLQDAAKARMAAELEACRAIPDDEERRVCTDAPALRDVAQSSLFVTNANRILKQQEGTLLITTFVQVTPDNPRKGTLWLLWSAPGKIANSIKVPINPKDLSQTVLQYRRLLSSDAPYDRGEFQKLSQKLYGWIIEPLEKANVLNRDGKNFQHLIFRLDRDLRYLPMASLHNGDNFLIERYTIANIINIDITNTTARRNPDPRQTNILALGTSKATGGHHSLPHVPAELDAIVQEGHQPDPNGGIYPGNSYLDEQFTRRALNIFKSASRSSKRSTQSTTA